MQAKLFIIDATKIAVKASPPFLSAEIPSHQSFS